MKQKLVILRGTTCSGKTTTSKLVRDYDNKIAWVTIDNIKVLFANYEDRTLDDSNDTAIALVKHLFEKGFSVIIDGIFKKPWHYEDLIKIAKDKNIPTKLYQLECSLDTLKERDKARDGVKQGLWPPLGDELVESLYKTVEENPIEGAEILNAEKMSPEEIARIIKDEFLKI